MHALPYLPSRIAFRPAARAAALCPGLLDLLLALQAVALPMLSWTLPLHVAARGLGPARPCFEIALAVAFFAAVACTIAMVLRQRRRYGCLTVFARAGVLLLLSVLALAAMRAPAQARWLGARDAFGAARIDWDPASRTLWLHGVLGPSLRHDLETALAAHPGASRLGLDSPGGLLDAALDASELVDRSGLDTRVDGRCASACAIVWAAGRRRLLGPRAWLGLHLAAPIAGVSGTGPRMAWMETRTLDWFRRAGLTAAMLDARRRAGAAGMSWIGAAQLARAGAARIVP